MRLIDYFGRSVDLSPDRYCLHDGVRGWTYRDVRAQNHRVANLAKDRREPRWVGRDRKI